jgi:histidine ammonia-lyase
MTAQAPPRVEVARRADLTLDAFRAVAWARAGVRLAPEATARIDRCHAAFQAMVRARLAEDPHALLYGVTTAPGDGAAQPISERSRARQPKGLWTASSWGEPLPERVVRGIVLARLASFLEGHAAVRGETAAAVAAMLDAPGVPAVPAQGNGGAGEILPLGHLFHELAARLDLEPRERMALINGSPCAAALVADAALAGRGRLELAERAFALSAEALLVPLEAYAADLEPLWNDEHEARALRTLRSLLDGGDPDRQGHQGPVSHRILPRVLGRAGEAQAHAEAVAAASLAAVTDNPIYLPPDATRPHGALVSNGSFHNPRAQAALDGLGFAWADLCQLAQRHVDKLFQHPVTGPALTADEWTIKTLHMAENGWAEEARAAAQPTLLSLGGFGQNDVPSLAPLAWRKAMAVGACLDQALAGLAAVASQALHARGRPAPPALAPFLAEVRAAFPPVDDPRPLAADAERLGHVFAARVLPDQAQVATSAA